MSTNTGRAPSLAMDPAVAKNENGVVTTSSPAPISERHQRRKKRVGARRHAYGVRNSEKRFELALQAFDLGTQNELLRIADARDRLEHVAAQRRELCFEVEQRDFLRPSTIARDVLRRLEDGDINTEYYRIGPHE